MIVPVTYFDKVNDMNGFLRKEAVDDKGCVFGFLWNGSV